MAGFIPLEKWKVNNDLQTLLQKVYIILIGGSFVDELWIPHDDSACFRRAQDYPRAGNEKSTEDGTILLLQI